MKTILLTFCRTETDSYVSIHVDIASTKDIKRYKNYLGKGWCIYSYLICKCPKSQYTTYLGSRIWKIKNEYIVLFPGCLEPVSALNISSIDELKNIIGDTICMQ